jgi:hypothetical protein
MKLPSMLSATLVRFNGVFDDGAISSDIIVPRLYQYRAGGEAYRL